MTADFGESRIDLTVALETLYLPSREPHPRAASLILQQREFK